jgi:general secretion pathway protein D
MPVFVDIKFVEKPLSGVFDDLKQRHGIEFQLDYRALDGAAIPSDTPVTKSIKGITLRSALNILLGDLDLTYVVQNGVLKITTEAEAKKLQNWPFSLQIAMWLAVAAFVLWVAFLCGRAWPRRATKSN